MSVAAASIIGIILALGATVVLYIFVMPRKKDGKLPKFLQLAHDYFHFKRLFLEIVLKFFFALGTFFCIATGFFMLFSWQTYYGWGETYTHYNGLYGLILIVGGPIVLRLFYEMMMMFVLLVQNVIDINRKLKGEPEEPKQEPQPVAFPQNQTPLQQNIRFCGNCGTQFDASVSDVCPNCGTRLSGN